MFFGVKVTEFYDIADVFAKKKYRIEKLFGSKYSMTDAE